MNDGLVDLGRDHLKIVETLDCINIDAIAH